MTTEYGMTSSTLQLRLKDCGQLAEIRILFRNNSATLYIYELKEEAKCQEITMPKMRKAILIKQQICKFNGSEFRDQTHRCKTHRHEYVKSTSVSTQLLDNKVHLRNWAAVELN